MVVEADESDGTFLALRPEIAVVTNVEADHLDHYGTFDGPARPRSADSWPAPSGAAVVGADDPVAAELGRAYGAATVGVARRRRLPDASRLTLGRSSVAFDLAGPDGPLGRLAVPVPGSTTPATPRSRRSPRWPPAPPFDARGARAGPLRRGRPPVRVPRRGRRGDLRRRLRPPARARSAPPWPRPATAAGERVVAVFQPHRYTRTAELAEEFGEAFGDADVVVVTDVYGAGEPPVPGVSGRAGRRRGGRPAPGDRPVVYAPGRDELRRPRAAGSSSPATCAAPSGPATSPRCPTS